MNHPKRGRCIILNYEQFDIPGLSELVGTGKDALQKTFTDLKFKVVFHQNKNYLETMKIFSKGNSFTI